MANELRIPLKLDVAPFSEGLKAGLKMGQNFRIQFNEIVSGVRVDVDETAFQKEIDDLEKKYKEFERKVEDDPVEPKVNPEKAQSGFKKITASIATVSVAAGGLYMAFNKVSGKLSELVELSNAQERADRKVQQGIKSTGAAAGYTFEELKKMSAELQGISTFGDEDIMNNVTAQLLTFTNVTEDRFSRAQQVIMDVATVLDGDLKSASLQVGKALNDPISSLGALTRSGIQFSKEQKETIKQLAETNRLAEAQDIILKELERQYGGQAAAAAEGGGQLKQFNNIIGDSKERLGDYIKSAIIPVTESMERVALGFLEITDPAKQSLDIVQNSQVETENLKTKFDDLTGTLLILAEKEKLSNEELKIKEETIAELQRVFPNYFSNLTTQADNYDTLQTAISNARGELENYTNQLIQNAVVQKYADQIADLSAKMIENNTSIKQAEIDNEKLRTAMVKNEDQARMNNQRMQENNMIIQMAKTLNGELEAKLNDVKSIYDIAKQAADEFTKSAIPPSQVNEDIDEVSEKVLQIGDSFSETSGTATSRWGNMLEGMLINTEEFAEAAKQEFIITQQDMMIHLGNVASQWAQTHQDEFNTISQLSNATKSVYDNLIAYRTQQIQNETNKKIKQEQKDYERERKRIQTEIKDEEKQKEALAQLEQRFSDRVSNLKEEQNQKELAARKKMKAVKYATAVSDVAVGVAKALSSGIPPWNLALAALTGAAGAVEIATIAASPYATGGKVPGGEQLIRVNEEGEEFVMNAFATRILGDDLLAKIMQFPQMAKAALMNVAMPAVNIPRPKYAFASGGSTSNVTTSTTINNNIDGIGNLLSSIDQKLTNLNNSFATLQLVADIDQEKLAFLVQNGTKLLNQGNG